MFVIIEADNRWAGMGVDWFENAKGVRLGWVAIHMVSGAFDAGAYIKALREREKCET